MGKRISIFSGYNQRENRTTNYCLLVLKRIYKQNACVLAEVLGNLIGEDFRGSVGVEFLQQERRGAGIPDAVIRQQAFTIYIETKNYAWFSDDQLEAHLDALHNEEPGRKILIALGEFESREKPDFGKIRKLCEGRYQGQIIFACPSFEDFLEALRLDSLPQDLTELISDFTEYLEEQNLLPKWKDLLVVVNCARTYQDVLSHQVYLCPTTSAYSHRKCRYFGLYHNKKATHVSFVRGVIDLLSAGAEDEAVNVKWRFDGINEELTRLAREKHGQLRPDQYPCRVFILGKFYETSFVKDGKYGMQANKQYFNVSDLQPSDAEDLAEKLKGQPWSKYDAPA